MKILIFFFLVIFWTYFNVFFTPFVIYGVVITEPYLLMNKFLIYRDFAQHHTPLLRFLLVPYYEIFGLNYRALQVFVFLLLSITQIMIFYTARQISQKIAFLSSFLFLLWYFPLFHNTFIDEISVSFFLVLSTFFFIKFIKTKKNLDIFLTGIFFGLSFLTKQSSLGFFFAIPLSLLFYGKKSENQGKKRNLITKFSFFYFILGILFPFTLIISYFFLRKGLHDFIYYNFIFNLINYQQQTTPYAFSDGMKILLSFLVLLIPPLKLFSQEKNFERKSILFFLISSTLILSSALWPSFLPDHLVIALPLIVISYSVCLRLALFSRDSLKWLAIPLFFFTFLQYSSFKNYLINLRENGGKSSFILDYNQDEIETATWIKKNTLKEEKIMVMANHLILYLSDRLPANKYIYLMGWHITPLEKTGKEVIEKAPRIVIFEESPLLSAWPQIKKWPFLSYLYSNYKLIKTFGRINVYEKIR